MALQAKRFTKPPNKNPKLYCRLCFSISDLTLLASAEGPAEILLIPVIFKQLFVQLLPDDFPCSICVICQEKLEELKVYNDDGLLDTWEDEGLREYRRICRAANDAVRKPKNIAKRAPRKRKPPSNNKIILPFKQLDDSRYECTLCQNLVFNHIEACIKHYHEIHPDTNLSTENPTIQRTRGFVCTICTQSFDQIDKLLSHRETHKSSHPILTGINPLAELSGESQNGPMQPNINPYSYLFKCTICQAGFDNIDNLIEHRADIHEPQLKRKKPTKSKQPVSKPIAISPPTYNCIVCDQTFDNLKSYSFHLNAMHERNICDICGEEFPAASVLVKHQTMHRVAEKPNYSVPLPSPNQQYSPLYTVADNTAVQGITMTSGEENGFSCEMFLTCSGCLLAFRTDMDLNEHYKDCPAQLLMPEDTNSVDDETKIVEISDDE